MKKNLLRKEVRCSGRLYDVTEFIHRHPGGSIMEYYVNNQEDATLAIQQFHYRSAKKVDVLMKSLKSRPDDAVWEENQDEETKLKYQNMTMDFVKLHHELEAEGYFKPCKWHVTFRISEVVLTTGIGGYLSNSGNVGLALVGMVMVAIAIGRCGHVMHECGHNSLTGHPKVDKWLDSVVSVLGFTTSAFWWRDRHNRHHAMVQRIHHDIDLHTGPYYVTNVKVAGDPPRLWKLYYRCQALLWLPFGTVTSMLNFVLWESPVYVWQNRVFYEAPLIALKLYALFAYIPLPYVVGSHMIAAVVVMINMAMSHSHMPITDKTMHWLESSLIHTININSSWLCDWWMGYLNYQIEHHLFPTMPQFRNPQIMDRVKELARKYKLPYICTSYWGGVKAILKNLHTVGRDI